MSTNQTDTARVLRLTNAIIDDDDQIARLVIDEANAAGRVAPLMFGLMAMASTLIEAAVQTDGAAVRGFLDQLIAAHLDDNAPDNG